MDKELNVIPGEAPESDDEENFNLSKLPSGMTQPLSIGVAITGEAPESDSSLSPELDEAEDVLTEASIGSVSSAASALSSINPSTDKQTKLNLRAEPQYNSLLHKKLRERNALLRRGLEDFVHQTIDIATKDLNSIDQHLLKSQVTLQEAVSSLRHVQTNLSQMHSKLVMATSVNLPSVNTDFLQLP